MAVAHINPRMLRWAVDRAGMRPEDLAGPMKKDVEVVTEWMRDGGEALPTFRQAQDIASRVHVPFGYLFIDEPPNDDLPIPDFRRLHGAAEAEPSVDLREVLSDVLIKQDWYRDYRKRFDDEPLPFVGLFSIRDAPEDVAADMAERLEFSQRARRESQREGFLREFGRSAEAIGILVMRSGTVGGNTRRKLDVSEFRGFAISDPLAPAVFINGADAIAAQTFTLGHELAHIWIGESGISDVELGENEMSEEVEDFCNRTASELLVPWAALQERWPRPGVPLEDWIRQMAREFHVSSVMIARSLWQHESIDRETFFEFYATESSQWSQRSADGEQGGDYYLNAGVRNSRLLSEAVIESMRSARTTVGEASNLLGVKPKNLSTLAKKLGFE